MLNLRAIAGEYDLQERHIDIGKLPVFLENQQKGNYKVRLDPGDYGGDMILKFNLSYEADPEIAKWFSNADFRRALSLGIDRDQINETFWLGTGTPGSVVPADANKYSPGPECRKLWATLDLKQANELLDKIGLDKKDAEGYRLRTDGKGRLRLEVMTLRRPVRPVHPHLRDDPRAVEEDRHRPRASRSSSAASARSATRRTRSRCSPGTTTAASTCSPSPATSSRSTATSGGGPLYGDWFQSNGEQGKEPPPRLKESDGDVAQGVRRAGGGAVQLGKEIWKIAADEVYAIGVVGLGAASQGVRVVKNNMGNVPARHVQQPGRQDARHLAAGDVLLQVVATDRVLGAGWCGGWRRPDFGWAPLVVNAATRRPDAPTPAPDTPHPTPRP